MFIVHLANLQWSKRIVMYVVNIVCKAYFSISSICATNEGIGCAYMKLVGYDLRVVGKLAFKTCQLWCCILCVCVILGCWENDRKIEYNRCVEELLICSETKILRKKVSWDTLVILIYFLEMGNLVMASSFFGFGGLE